MTVRCLALIVAFGTSLVTPVMAQQRADEPGGHTPQRQAAGHASSQGDSPVVVSVSIRFADKAGNPVPLPLDVRALEQTILSQGSPVFTFESGAAYVSFDGGKTKYAVSGGGASGCLTLELVDRAKAIDELRDKLGAPTPTP